MLRQKCFRSSVRSSLLWFFSNVNVSRRMLDRNITTKKRASRLRTKKSELAVWFLAHSTSATLLDGIFKSTRRAALLTKKYSCSYDSRPCSVLLP